MRLRSPALLLLLLSGLRAGVVDIQEEEARAMVGSDVVLNCIYTKESSFDLKDLFVYWQIGVADKLMIVTYYLPQNRSARHYNNQYKDRAHLSLDSMKRGDFSLHLYNVTPQDEQKFNCIVFQKAQRILDVVVTLHVAAPYSMPMVSTPSGTPEGEELTITCTSMGGYPRPNVFWINKTDNSLLDEALQNSTVSVNALGLYDVVSVLRVRWTPNLNVDCCIENVLLLQNLTSSQTEETETLMGTKDSITKNPEDTHERRTGATGTQVAVPVVLLLGAVLAAAAAVWAYRRCPRHWTYTAGARAARPELQLTDHA
ncbi:PREDICTED: ICOS ligand isoform X1 [Hipposideros armiger]|uniref:ICOS ligand n=2 Tax=Hipposideros armiger TaxID=186990 RepID=A0A8B7PZ54_HIPAR|nr:PREDICTED: ICOS ligand isoform X1 [Hipposideros armiger]XP_019480533.1 PREDICTED: ICOS ligand isoform X1 [Hipposideros armiger]XP_019480534.1 PREDICTED: ICOS ligand isoform X1 [Hipposideros armiger]